MYDKIIEQIAMKIDKKKTTSDMVNIIITLLLGFKILY